MKKLPVFAVLMGLSTVLIAKGDAYASKMKIVTLAGFYGMYGIAMVPTYPILAGKNMAYLEGALNAYELKQRKEYQAYFLYGTEAPLSDGDIGNIMAFLPSLK